MRLGLEVKMTSQLADSISYRCRADPKGDSVNNPSELLDWSAPMTGSGKFRESVVISTSPKMMALDRSSRCLLSMILLKATEYQDSRR